MSEDPFEKPRRTSIGSNGKPPEKKVLVRICNVCEFLMVYRRGVFVCRDCQENLDVNWPQYGAKQ